MWRLGGDGRTRYIFQLRDEFAFAEDEATKDKWAEVKLFTVDQAFQFLRRHTDAHVLQALRRYALSELQREGITVETDTVMLELLARAIISGRARIVTEALEIGSAGAPGMSDEVEPVEGTRRREQRRSWIEIELIDDNDQPVPRERYEVIFPDGSDGVFGRLDEQGFARVLVPDPGQCQVSFPDLDKEAWQWV